MENNFECGWMDIGGHCIKTYQILENNKIYSKECNECKDEYNKCDACCTSFIYEEKDYCKDCINNKTKGE